jgi:hypothetical protein
MEVAGPRSQGLERRPMSVVPGVSYASCPHTHNLCNAQRCNFIWCKSDEPMADAFIRAIALEIGLGNEFDPAFVYAVKQGWLDESKKWGWTNLTKAGEAAAA